MSDFRWNCTRRCHLCATSKWIFLSFLILVYLFPKQKFSSLPFPGGEWAALFLSAFVSSVMWCTVLCLAGPSVGSSSQPSEDHEVNFFMLSPQFGRCQEAQRISVSSFLPQGRWHREEQGLQRHLERICLPHCCSKQRWVSII